MFRINEKISLPAVFLVFVFLLSKRFFFGNVYGILMSSIAAYLFLPKLFGFNAFSFNDLVLWFEGVPIELKSSILTSIITVSGFLVAFATASYAWRSQLLGQMKIESSEDIDAFFSDFLKAAISLRIYVKQMIEAYEQCQSGSRERAAFLIRYLGSGGMEAQADRSALSRLSSDVHRLYGKYTVLLASHPFLDERMKDAIKAMGLISESVWFTIPIVLEGENEVNFFIAQSDYEKWDRFLQISMVNEGIVSAVQGNVRGVLQSGVMTANFWLAIYFLRNIRVMNDLYKDLRMRIKKLKSRD